MRRRGARPEAWLLKSSLKTESRIEPGPFDEPPGDRGREARDKSVKTAMMTLTCSIARRPGRPEPGGPLVGLSGRGDAAAQRRSISTSRRLSAAYPAYKTPADRTESSDLIHSAGDTGLLLSAWSGYRGRISPSPRPLIRGPKSGSPVVCTRWFLNSASSLTPRSAPEAGPFYAIPPGVDVD